MAVLLALMGFSLPAAGADSAPYVVSRVGAGGGRMALLDTFDFWSTLPESATYGGVEGSLAFYSRLKSSTTKARLLMVVSTELRLVAFEDSRAGPMEKFIGVGRVSFGVENPWVQVRGGAWFGNIGVDEALLGFVSFSARLGPPDRYVRLSLSDQEGCYLSQCLVGLEGMWGFDRVGLLAGGSLGLVTGSRWFLQVPVLLRKRSIEIRPGVEVGYTRHDGISYSVTFSMSWRSPSGALSNGVARSTK